MKSRILHYVEVFAASFGLTLIVNAEHVLDARGLDAMKAALVALAITAAKFGLSEVRKRLLGQGSELQPPGA